LKRPRSLQRAACNARTVLASVAMPFPSWASSNVIAPNSRWISVSAFSAACEPLAPKRNHSMPKPAAAAAAAASRPAASSRRQLT
jgi:hypothetical protein